MHNQPVRLKLNKRTLVLLLALGLISFLMWQSVHANPIVTSFPAQVQIDQIMPSLDASEAEHASGAYLPGVGAVFIMDLIRGPNAAKGKIPAYGVRDWTIYLMQTFGPQLNAVPANESITFSIEFLDYSDYSYHQFILASKESDVADPTKYTIWLDGKSFAQAAPPEPTSTTPAITPTGGKQSTTPKNATPVAPIKTPLPGSANLPTVGPVASEVVSTQPIPTAVGTSNSTSNSKPTAQIAITSPTAIAFNFTDQATGKSWKPLNGQWAIDPTGYTQNQLGSFDLVSLYTQSISGNYDFQMDVKFISGQMGGGLVFNTPGDSIKNGAQIISYAGAGKFLQWGYFDDSGVFQYQGGSPVPNGADGKNHHLIVRVRANQYSVVLDGAVLGKNLPLWHPNGGFVGLLASTSQVVFNNAKLDQLGP